ncbi:MAG: ATP-binding cassette domain-containing protein [Planctomycetota bacterium]
MTELAFKVRDLHVSRHGSKVLRGVNLDLPARGVSALLGASGAGKSTLLRALNRLLDLEEGVEQSGRIEAYGSDIHAQGWNPDRLRERVGMLFQKPVLFPGSIEDNVLFALRRLGRRADRALCRAALEEAGLLAEIDERLAEPATRLSMGQRQRLILARALTLEPEVLLADEPTSALDVNSARAVEGTLAAFGERGAVLLVTHDETQAERLAPGRCLYLRRGRISSEALSE